MDQMERIAVARKIWELTDMNSRIYEDVAELYADLKYNAPVYVEICTGNMVNHRFCGHCRNEVNKGAKFCDQCGRELLGNGK